MIQPGRQKPDYLIFLSTSEKNDVTARAAARDRQNARACVYAQTVYAGFLATSLSWGTLVGVDRGWGWTQGVGGGM